MPTQAPRYIQRAGSFLLLLVFLCLDCSLLTAAPVNELKIGLLLDIESESSKRFENNLEQEVTALLGNRYKFSRPVFERSVSGWSPENILRNYRKLLSDPEVDVIVSAGVLSSAILAQQPKYPKPLLLLGLLDQELQQIPLTAEGKSGVHNLTYILMTRQFSEDLAAFYSVFPFKRLVIIADQKLIDVLPDFVPLLGDAVESKNSQVELITFTGSLNGLLKKIPDNADAVVLGGLYTFSDADMRRLIDHVNHLKLPSYSLLGVEDVRLGALAGAAVEANWQKIARRAALNIEQILDGSDPADLPATFKFERRLSLNMKTARLIDFSPTWETLAEVQQIGGDQLAAGPLLDFRQTVNEALKANLTLAIEKLSLDSAREDVSQARAPLFPSLSAAANATRIDEDSASVFQAENTYSGSLTMNQLIYSDSTLAGLAAQKHLFKSSEERYREVRYDIILNAGLIYLDILQAQSVERIRRNNLTLVRENLDVAEYRYRVGYAGVADVLRLQSEKATVTAELLTAQSTVDQAKINLNQFLMRPLDKEFRITDVGLADDILYRYGVEDIQAATNTPKDFEQLTRFLITEAMNRMPELQQLKEQLAAQERILASQKRKRWLPTVNLQGGTEQIFDRSGEGSDVLPDDDTNWNVNLNANWQLFSGGAISSEIRQARIERDRLQEQLHEAQRFIELTLRNALLDLRVKSANLNLTETSARAAKESYEIVQDSYARGAVNITDLLDAQNSALAAEQAAAKSVYDYYASLLQVERAMGNFSITSSRAEQEAFLERFKNFMDNK